MNKRYLIVGTILALLLVPLTAHANARLTNVTPVNGGCVSGPHGPATQAWDIEAGETYTITLEYVTECADGGTAATLDVRVNSSNTGNMDLVATMVATGVYEFDFTMPAEGICTYPINYCTTPGMGPSGIVVIRDDGVEFQAHLRASTFEAGCTNPAENIGGDCEVIGNDESSWGAIKATYK